MLSVKLEDCFYSEQFRMILNLPTPSFWNFSKVEAMTRLSLTSLNAMVTR